MIRINQVKLSPIKEESFEQRKQRLTKKICQQLKISEKEITYFEINKESIDARRKDDVLYIYSVDLETTNEKKLFSNKRIKNIAAVEKTEFDPLYKGSLCKDKRPVIVGFGPTGIFAAYILALNGYAPIVVERGKDVDSRQMDVDTFWKTGKLNVESNVQFGEGGAGTFSDGKLNTQIKDPSGRIEYVLKTLVKFGAPSDVIFSQKPHIGTDVLKSVICNMRKEILRMGGDIRFNERLDDFEILDGKLSAIILNGNERLETDSVILAIGHSARDTFRMLEERKVDLLAKDFAVGFRVSHPQNMINIDQYGMEFADYFGAAPYKLSAKADDGRGVYSFCMCPGGYVVNASSQQGRLCVNGMSYNARGGRRANSAIIVSVGVDDFAYELNLAGESAIADDPLIGLKFQELLEERTYVAGQGKIPFQSYDEFKGLVLEEPKCKSDGDITRKNEELINDDEELGIRGLCTRSNLKGILPSNVEKAFICGMEAFEKKLPGFAGDSAIIYGSEIRTSSPIRISRGENGMSTNISGIYPAGEGAGYAGGITSAAVDGIRAAFHYMENSTLC